MPPPPEPESSLPERARILAGRSSELVRRVLYSVLLSLTLLAWLSSPGVTQTQQQAPSKLGTPLPVKQIEPEKRRNLAYLSKDIPELTIADLPPRRFQIIDIHEHVLNEAEALRLLKVMDELQVERTCLMGSSRFTFTLNRRHGFERFLRNNEAILEIKRKYPDRFCAFVTLDPLMEGNLELLQDYVRRGADGLKLYTGHGGGTGKGPFHPMPLNDPRMLPIYDFAQRTQLPLVFHVNLLKFQDEFVRVMEAFPYMRVNVPHFGLKKNTEERLESFAALLERYPNLYSDISFGWDTIHTQGFEALAKWRTRSRDYLVRHADRFMFGSDMVLERYKTDDYIINTLRSYIQLLETERFRFFREPDLPMHGLSLPDSALKAIYEGTPRRFLLLDEEGNPPDRTQGWPPPGWEGPPPGLPPLVKEVLPLNG